MMYTYTTLRYIHDPLREEFVNVMIVALYDNKIYTKVTDNFFRIENFFQDINVEFLKSQLHHIDLSLGQIIFSSAKDVGQFCKLVLATGDQGFVWSPHVGGGITHNIDQTMEQLKNRFIL